MSARILRWALLAGLMVSALALHALAEHWAALRPQVAWKSWLATWLPLSLAWAWGLGWAIAARALGGPARVPWHLMSAFAGLLAWGAGRALAPLAAAALRLPLPDVSGAVASAALLALLAAWHLRQLPVRASTRRLALAGVAAWAAMGMAVAAAPEWQDDAPEPPLASFAPPWSPLLRAAPREQVLATILAGEAPVAAGRTLPVPESQR